MVTFILRYLSLNAYFIEVVINLALSSATNTLINEDKIVTQLGMSYFHIPVDWEDPKIDQLKIFINTLQALGVNKAWIHCAKNYRVTAFIVKCKPKMHQNAVQKCTT